MDVNSVHLEHLVIDSGAIIRGQGFNYFNCSKKFWTVQEVFSEIRDGKARHLLASLPFEIEIRNPSDNAMRAVIEFSRKTGDLAQLSMVDLKVLALTYDLEVETNGTRYIRTEPKKTIKRPVAPNKLPVAAKPVKEVESCECCEHLEGEGDSREGGEWTSAGHHKHIHKPAPSAFASSAEQPAGEPTILKTTSLDSESESSEKNIDSVEISPEVEGEEGLEDYMDEMNLSDDESEEGEPVPAPVFNMEEEEDSFPGLGAPASRREAAPVAVPGSWAKALATETSGATAAPQVVLAPLDGWAAGSNSGRKALSGGILRSIEAPEASSAPTGASTSRIMRSTGAAEYSSAQSNMFRAEEDDGEDWINPSNITSARATGQGMLGGGRTQGVKSKATVYKAKVACVTTDFSMENVVLQMGMKLLSVEGRLIHRVKQWVLRCAACFTIHYDIDRLFCSKCGVNMLQRIAASTDSKTGELKLHLKHNYVPNTRGMVHSLPKAGTQGRYDGELLMREDQLLTGIWRQKVAKIKHDVKSAFGEDITGDVGMHINKREYGLKVGLGRRNPNADKGRERRGKKKTKH